MTLAANGINSATKIYTWTYADAAARLAATGFGAVDVGALALQLDDGSLWRLAATTPTWAAISTGLSNPMSAAGDLIVGGAGGAATRLAKGGNNTVLGVDAAGALGYRPDPTAGALTKIAETIVPAGGAAAITFAAIPGSYRNLALRLTGRMTPALLSEVLRVRLNGDTAANYYGQRFAGNAGSTSATEYLAATSLTAGILPAASAPAGVPGICTLLLPDYARTAWHKQVIGQYGYSVGNSTGFLLSAAFYGVWRSTVALTAIELAAATGLLAEGTVATLWGEV